MLSEQYFHQHWVSTSFSHSKTAKKKKNEINLSKCPGKSDIWGQCWFLLTWIEICKQWRKKVVLAQWGSTHRWCQFLHGFIFKKLWVILCNYTCFSSLCARYTELCVVGPIMVTICGISMPWQICFICPHVRI